VSQEKDLGLGNQDFCPWRECQTSRTTKIREAVPDELGSPHCTEGQCVVVHGSINILIKNGYSYKLVDL
jgi:hypothetical protein